MATWNVTALVATVFLVIGGSATYKTTSLLDYGRLSLLTAFYEDTLTDPWCFSVRFICLFHPRLTFKESLWEGIRKEVDLF